MFFIAEAQSTLMKLKKVLPEAQKEKHTLETTTAEHECGT